MLIASLSLAGMALAQGPGGGPGRGPGPGSQSGPDHQFGEHRPPFERAFGGPGTQGRWWNNPKIAEQLKLTDEQKKAFDDILLQHRTTLIDLRGNVEKAELAMEPLIRDDQPNEAKILAQIDKVAQSRAELEKANARYLLAIRSKLTPEQWKQVQAFRANHGPEGRNWQRGGEQPRGDRGVRQQPPPPPGPQGMADEGAGSERPAPPIAGAVQ
jgi:Spy/CpxP family protein refolding chaperone